MKIIEIFEKVKSGDMILDSAGHSVNENFLRRLQHCFDNANGAGDGGWSKREGKSVEEVDRSMRDFHQRVLDYHLEQDEVITGSVDTSEVCFGCGQRLGWVLTGDKLQLRNYYRDNPEARFGGEFFNHPTDYRCPWETVKPFCYDINVNSKLVFVNFFRFSEDAPDGKKYLNEYSLNYTQGRYNITKYKSAHNVAYGQMTNTSVGVYVNDEKTSVIIGPAWHPAEYEEFETDEEWEKAISKPLFEGYKMVGTICLDVWRWEATDIETIEKNGSSLEKIQEERRDLVVLDVKHGLWAVQHNYDVIRCDPDDNAEEKFNYIYSRFDLKKETT